MFFGDIYISQENKVLFDFNDLDIYKLNEENFNIFEDIYHGKAKKKSFNLDKYVELENFLNKKVGKSNKCLNNDNIKYVKIHTSNMCNLKCKYCYASYGDYGKGNSIMDKSLAKNIAMLIKCKFPNLKTIAFLGGEPFMAIEAIEEICSYFENENILFTIESNCTLLDDNILRVLKKYNIKITASIDGPKEINDENRIFKDNKGTFDTISHNVEKIVKHTNNLVAVQATYTKQAENKYTKNEIAKYLQSKFNVNFVSVQEVATEDESLKVRNHYSNNKNKDRKDVEFLFDSIMNDEYYFEYDLTPILYGWFNKQSSDYLCHAGLSSLTIDVKGNIWPCQLYMKNENYLMGNIQENDVFLSNNYKKVQNELSNFRKSKIDKCKSCMAKYWCSICLGTDALFKKKVSEDDFGKSFTCIERSKITKLVLDELARYVKEDKISELNKKISVLASKNSIDRLVKEKQ